MEHGVIHFDKQAYESELNQLRALQGNLQRIVDKYDSLDLPNLKADELWQLIFRTEALLMSKTMEGVEPRAAGMLLNRSKFYEMIEKPAGYTELAQLVNSTLLECAPLAKDDDIFDFLSVAYQFVDGKVFLDEAELERLQVKHETRADKPLTLDVLEFAKKLIETVNETEIFKKTHLLGVSECGLGHFFYSLMKMDFQTGEVTIKSEGIKRWDYVN